MFRKIRKIQDRIEGVHAYLAGPPSGAVHPKNADALLADAYRWFYQSGRYDFRADGEKDRFNYDICTLELFDVLLDGKSVVAENVRILSERAEAYKRAPRVFSTYATDSDVSVSPFFDESFMLIPPALQRQVVKRLKELAKTTDQPATSVQNHIKRACKLKNGIPCLEVASGINLAVEFEAVGVCFLGFLIAEKEYRQEGALVMRSSMPATLKLLWLMCFIVLLFALLYVPYDVVLIREGDNLRVFSGYDFIWAKPDISEVCDWHTNRTSSQPYYFNRRCYSQVSLPRAMLGVLAGLTPFLIATLVVLRRRK